MKISSGLDWNSVQVNFNDTNSAMNNSANNISQAGTIFGQIRKSILEEEQKTIDNEYKERTLAENARQFNLTDRLGRDKLSEETRSNKINEGLKERELMETSKYRQSELGLRGALLKEEQNRNKILDEERKIKVDDAKDRKEIDINSSLYMAGTGTNLKAREEAINTLTSTINDPNATAISRQRAQVALDNITLYDKSPDKTHYDRNNSLLSVRQRMGDLDAGKLVAENERSMVKTAKESADKLKKLRHEYQSEAYKTMTDNNLDDDTRRGLTTSFDFGNRLLKEIGSKDEINPTGVTNEMINQLGVNENWIGDRYSFGGNTARYGDGDIQQNRRAAEAFIASLANGRGTLSGKPLSHKELLQIRKKLGLPDEAFRDEAYRDDFAHYGMY